MPEEEKKTDQGGDPSGAGKENEAPAFDPKDWSMKVNGEEVFPRDKEHLVQLAQMGHDYTGKTQGLSKQRENFEQLVNDRALELYRGALEKGENGKQGEGNADPDPDDPNTAFNKRLDVLESQNQKSRDAETIAAQDQELGGLMDQLVEKHKLSKEDEQLVLIGFRDSVNQESDVEGLLESLAASRVSANKERNQKIIQEYIKTKTSDPFASGETGKSGGDSSADLAKPPKTFAEARARAEARLINAGT